MRHTVFGPFSALNLHSTVWQLRAHAGAGHEILLRGPDPGAIELLTGAHIISLTFDWGADSVTVTSTGANGERRFTFDGAIIHEPRPRLYESLPLSPFDSDARRFWRRVFRMMRIPGGRFLVGLFARRKRRSPGAAEP